MGLRGRIIGLSACAAIVLGSLAPSLPAEGAHRAHHLVSFEDSPRAVATATGGPVTTQWCLTNWKFACYTPSQMQAAYDLGPLFNSTKVPGGYQGQGQTIAIIDPYGSPTITTDLTAFDSAFSLPAPPSFTVLTPPGLAPVPAFKASNADMMGWAGETTLDVEWAHAMAPKASILLVTTPTDEVEGTSGLAEIVAAENYVIKNKLATVISQSFGATEQTFTSAAAVNPYRSAFIAASTAGVSVLAATGDAGATDYQSNGTSYFSKPVIDWPASDPLVTAVGGTLVSLSAQGSHASPDVAWNDTYNTAVTSTPFPNATGGGLSTFFSRPTYQAGLTAGSSKARSTPDISMSAACSGEVEVYETFGGSTGWYTTCGTSESTPMFAGIVALADQVAGHGLGPLNPKIYSLASQPGAGIVDVTSGNNTVQFPTIVKGVSTPVIVKGFNALAGYDLASGVGTIDAAKFVPALAAAP